MKTETIKTHLVAIVASALVSAFFVSALIKVINLTELGFIHWKY